MFTQQSVKQRQPLQRNQQRHSERSYTDVLRNKDTNISTNCLNVSICQDIEFEKNTHNKIGIKQSQEFRFMSILYGQPIENSIHPNLP